MKIVQINVLCGTGSTGMIACEISKRLSDHDIENYVFYSRQSNGYERGICFSDKTDLELSRVKSKLFGNNGFNAKKSTRNLISKLEEIDPDIVHLHNLHSHDINFKMLFEYLKSSRARVIWTFHDCWAITGYCTHYTRSDCEKWKTQCYGCNQRKTYSILFDKSRELYNKKKELLRAIDDLTIVAPSEWMADVAANSFLGDRRIEVINNGIDLSVFRPRKSDFAKRYKIDNKKIILGIPKSGLQYYIELRRQLPSQYHIVLVSLDKNEINNLPEGMTGIPYTNSAEELAEIYSAADVFVNTTLADTFPTVNLESLACGTPIVTFKTGGSAEIIDEKTGIAIERRDIPAMCEAVKKICSGPDRSSDCVSRAERLYNAKDRFNDYIDLYNRTGRFK